MMCICVAAAVICVIGACDVEQVGIIAYEHICLHMILSVPKCICLCSSLCKTCVRVSLQMCYLWWCIKLIVELTLSEKVVSILVLRLCISVRKPAFFVRCRCCMPRYRIYWERRANRYVARFFMTWPSTDCPSLIDSAKLVVNGSDDPEAEIRCILQLYRSAIVPHLHGDIRADAERRVAESQNIALPDIISLRSLPIITLS
jgi:hypothetical protein